VSLPTRGRFTFPAPYSTEGARITTAADCGGNDCVDSVGYSYWRNMNNHTGSNTILIALGLNRNRGGAGPSLFSYDKTTGETRNLGPIFDPNSALGWGTGEGWYFSATMPTALYVNDGPRMIRYDVLTHAATTIVDVTAYAGAGTLIWQMHTSNNDLVHSFTVKDANSQDLGCGVFFENTRQFRMFPARGELDECQIDKSGRFLVIKENADGVNAYDNVVEDLQAGTESILADENGALGHSDLGFGYGVGEDNWYNAPNAVRVWNYTNGGFSDGRLVYQSLDWNFGDLHVAHSNARADLPLEQQVACNSNTNRSLIPEANEIVCYRLDGSLQVLVVAPVMTDLAASGGGDSYSQAPKGNLDVTGEYFIWTTNMGTNRQDAFIVRVPLAKLGVTPGTSDPGTVTSDPTPVSTEPVTTDPVPTTPPPSSTGVAVPVTWTSMVRSSVSGTTLTKTTGCDGCQDAGAASTDSIRSGDGYFEFTVDNPSLVREAGFSNGNSGTGTAEIVYGLRLGNGGVEVREANKYRADTTVVTGDVLRVQVVNGALSYTKNGTLFYRSRGQVRYPLIVDTSLSNMGATITNAKIGVPGATAPTGTDSTTTTTSGTTVSSSWVNAVNVDMSGGVIRKVSGCDGCGDAGAVSSVVFSSGSGYVEFTGASGAQFIGLAASSSVVDESGLAFSLSIAGPYAEVREAGAYRADVPVTSTDHLRIALLNGRVVYAKNGTVFYTSTVTPASSLRPIVSLYALGASVQTPVVGQ
jgi:hypothetical protein